MEGRCVLEQIQIKNLRSLKDTDLIKLCPINVLVGNNSSGKSTFLRTFPLIKQSISKYTNGPILWAGDVDDYVDFGSYNETITNDGISNSIELTFVFETRRLGTFLSPFYYSFPELKIPSNNVTDKIKYSLIIKNRGIGEDCGEYVSEVKMHIGEHELCIAYSEDSNISTILLDGDSCTPPPHEDEDIRYSYYLPRAYFFSSTNIFGAKLPPYDSMVDEVRKIIMGWFERKEKQRISKTKRSYLNLILMIGELICRGIDVTDLSSNYSALYETSDPDALQLEKDFAVIEQHLRGFNDQNRKSFIKSILCVYCCAYLPDIDEYLSEYFKQVHYIAPLRATAERYYRLRNTAIDEIDHQGKNLAIFLNSLSEKRLEGFQAWTLQYFGFRIFVQKESGHLSVNVELKESTGRFNLSDTGFGYSQILPIITQLWMLSTKERTTRNNAPLVVAIEQPELHLHPSLQAKLAKVFIASIQLARDHGYQLQLILETHSETIVNYFGSAIARGELLPKDISVILFDKCLGSKYTDVRISSFDNSGYLEDWPIGFLSSGE